MSDSFLSIVQPLDQKGGDKGMLLVRARVMGDIERIFPKAKVTKTPARDYLFRALIPRMEVAKAMSEEVRRISYDNFKSSVDEDDRHSAYLRCWVAMNNLQRSRTMPKREDLGGAKLPWDDDFFMR